MKYSNWIPTVISFCVGTLFCVPRAVGTQSGGRFSVGGYSSTENFHDTTFGVDRNDFLIISSRLYYRIWDIGRGKWEWTADLRDNYDFYDKLDPATLSLTDRDTFQVRQLYTRWVNPEGRWSAYLGRFDFLEAGDIYVDGAELEYRWTKQLRSAIFGGLNPKTTDQTYLHFNNNTTVGGASLTYQSNGSNWERNFYLTHAIVEESENEQTDRLYFFHQMNYQWKANCRLLTLAYIDFVPHTYVQIGSFLWQQEWARWFASELNLFGIDTIEYTRLQGIRETLPSSPYKEAKLRLISKPYPDRTLALEALTGVRQIDNKSKTEGSIGYWQHGAFNRHWDIYGKLGERKNFVSFDQFVRAGLDYFSENWESNLDLEYAVEKYDTGTYLHPLTASLAISNYISRTLFTTLSAEYAQDESVTIMSYFFKMGYRFGSKDIPAVRSEAPLKGPL